MLTGRVTELEKQVFEAQRDIRILCARARGQYSKHQLQLDFQEGLQEMARKARRAARAGANPSAALASDADWDEEGESDDEDADEPVCAVAEELKRLLPVHTVTTQLTGLAG